MRLFLLSVAALAMGCSICRAAPPPGTVDMRFNACPDGLTYGLSKQLISSTTLVLQPSGANAKYVILDFSSVWAKPTLTADNGGGGYTLALPILELGPIAAVISRHNLLAVDLTFHPDGNSLVIDALRVGDTNQHC